MVGKTLTLDALRTACAELDAAQRDYQERLRQILDSPASEERGEPDGYFVNGNLLVLTPGAWKAPRKSQRLAPRGENQPVSDECDPRSFGLNVLGLPIKVWRQ